MLRESKTHISHIALVANRISQANQGEIYKFLPGKSQRGSCHLERSEGSQLNGYFASLRMTGTEIQAPKDLTMSEDFWLRMEPVTSKSAQQYPWLFVTKFF